MFKNSSPDAGRRPDECVAVAPLLALRGTGTLLAAEVATVERHLAVCDNCQRIAALDDVLAAGLRDALTGATPSTPALQAEQIARAIAEQDDAEADGEDVPETDRGGYRAYPASAHLRSTASHRFSRLAAFAAVLIVSILAAYVFGSHVGNRAGGRVTPVPTISHMALPTVSPLLARQTVYLPTDAGVYALRASDGHVRWTYPAGIAAVPLQREQHIFGLSLDHATLYVLAAPPGVLVQPEVDLLALDAATGAVRWSVRVAGPSSAALLLAGDRLIVSPTLCCDTPDVVSTDVRTVHAFSASNGKPIWDRTLDEAPLAAPVFENGGIYIGTAGHVVALRAADGKVLWSTPILPSAQQQGTTPAEVNAAVALTAAGGHLYVLTKRAITHNDSTHGTTWEANLYLISTADGTHMWLDSIGNDPEGIAFAPAIEDTTAYVQWGSGITAISVASTPEPEWRFVPANAASENEAMTGATVAGGIVYTTDLGGVLAERNGMRFMENCTYAIRASDGAEIWRSPTNGGNVRVQPPTVAAGIVLVPAATSLHVLRASDGSPLWTYTTGGFSTAPALLGS